MNRNVRVSPVLAMVLAGFMGAAVGRSAPESAENSEAPVIEIGLCVDGSDFLYLRGSQMWIVHRHFELPGWHPECSQQHEIAQCPPNLPCPVKVRTVNPDGSVSDEISWIPEWFADESRAAPFNPGQTLCGQSGCTGFVSSILSIAPASVANARFLEVMQARGLARLIQSPSASNDYTAIILLDDDPPGGPGWYQLRMVPSFALRIGLCVDGSDLLHTSDTGIWVEHRFYELPGWHPECSSEANPPVVECPETPPCPGKVETIGPDGSVLSRADWSPDWFTDKSRTVRFDPASRPCGVSGCTGFTSSRFFFTSPMHLSPAALGVVIGRGAVTLQQNPAPSNDFIGIVLVNDDPPGGPAWYEIEMPFRTGLLTMPIDVKPGGDPNSINLESEGVVPVAILTTSAFDAGTISPASLRFGRTGIEASPTHFDLTDVDGDGDADLIATFRTQESGFLPGDEEAVLTGRTLRGEQVVGRDSIRAFDP